MDIIEPIRLIDSITCYNWQVMLHGIIANLKLIAQVDQSLSLWASKATQDSNFELAAKCHLAADRVAEAARVVARRADAESLRLAADLAASCDLQQLASAYLVEAAEKVPHVHCARASSQSGGPHLPRGPRKSAFQYTRKNEKNDSVSKS